MAPMTRTLGDIFLAVLHAFLSTTVDFT